MGEALELWRGPAYAGFEDTSFGRSERQRLDELHTNTVEDRWAAEVDAGRSAVAIPEVERLLAEHPWRERAWAILVLALCRAGRQGEALGARSRSDPARRGARCGSRARAAVLQARVLAHDPELLRLPSPPFLAATEVGAADGLHTGRPFADATALVREEAGTRCRGWRCSAWWARVPWRTASRAPGSVESLRPDVCPWRGLASYDMEHRPWFAGA